MTWAEPAWAWLFLLALPAVGLAWRSTRIKRQYLEILTGRGSQATRADQVAFVVPTLVFVLVLLALCRPQWGHVDVPRESHGLDILVALDVSRSMLADDLSPNRLVAAKDSLNGLVSRLGGDRIGLVAFAGSAFLVCPFTQDYAAFSSMLEEVSTQTVPKGGTSLESAINEAIRAFGISTAPGKVLIVISDGEDHAGDLETAATRLRTAGITVFAIAAGTPKGGIIPLGNGDFVRDAKGVPVVSRLRNGGLDALATLTGGYRVMLGSESGVAERIYADVSARLEETVFRGARQQPVERFQWPLGLAILLLLFECWARHRR